MTELQKIIDQHAGEPTSLLPILHDVQEEFGHIPETAVEPIAEALGRSKAEIYGVVSFYHDFRTTPAGTHEIKICRAEACQSVGAEKLVKDLLQAFGLNDFGTTKDGKVTIEAVYCLGLCPLSPAALVDGEPMGRASVKKLEGAVK